MYGVLVKVELAGIYYSKLRRLLKEIQGEVDFESARQMAIDFFSQVYEVGVETRRNVLRNLEGFNRHIDLVKYLLNLIIRFETIYQRYLKGLNSLEK